MKKKPPKIVEQGRVKKGPYGSCRQYGMNGAFYVKYKKTLLFVISSIEAGWDHVSVSVPDYNRVPSWAEMCFIKDQFWEVWETVIQFHPKRTEYVNINPYVLHLWKKQGQEYELPPIIFV